MDAVAPGLGADVVDGIADARRLPFTSAFASTIPTHHVDERIAGVRLLERNLAADRRNADAVAVSADSRDHALENPAGSARRSDLRAPEAQRVQEAIGRAPIVKMSR